MTPTATYRFQLRPGFGFDEVAELAGYLKALGISHVYLSPYLQAAPGSTHGYDIVDHSQVNRELGGAAAHARMVEALRAQGLGQVIDVVPNHMATSTPDNRFWWDLLENGRCSRYASYFDVDFHPTEARLHDKVLVPILGDHYGRVLEAGEIRLERAAARFRLVAHGSHVLPLDPSSVGELLRGAAERSASDELAFVADALVHLPKPEDATGDIARRRQRDVQVAYRLIERLMRDHAVAVAVDAQVAYVNDSIDALDQLIERQNYRMAYWRMARHDLDYRRFFDVDNLAALRIERNEVFEDTHATILAWVEAGVVDGLRIDHPDGLRNPQKYFERLRERAPNAWIVAEKLLARGETLPANWPVDGTTGYDFLGLSNALFVDPDGVTALAAVHTEFVGSAVQDFATLAREKKEFVLDQLLPSDLNRLTAVLVGVCEELPRFRDYSRDELRTTTSRLIACLPVYRTYVDVGPADERDRAYITHAAAAAEQTDAALDRRLLALIARVLLGAVESPKAREFRARFQQLAAATMAKGVEDTAYYCYSLLLSLNEVGGDPGSFSVSPDEFHAHCLRIQASHPTTMLASSTHDTKRSEDVRARISLLSECPARWQKTLGGLALAATRHRGAHGPDRAFEYFIYQTLVGAWPIDEERLLGYLQKAAREAKINTSWHHPSEAYETAVADFARGILDDSEFRQLIERFVAELRGPAERNTIAQLVLKLTAPGVPDTYQGNEVFRYDLTDPDNRRPIDYPVLTAKLRQIEQANCTELLASRDPDLRKLYVTHRLLQLRRSFPAWFGAEASYRPIAGSGRHAERILSFARGTQLIVAVPRLTAAIADNWGDSRIELPRGTWENVLCAARVRDGLASELFAQIPAAVLVRKAD
jgi:(1->4)-alpha-D-glucan 1-alpha-D-glucosylmutase